jgi:DNA-binding CsgD family transcriptional regulator
MKYLIAWMIDWRPCWPLLHDRTKTIKDVRPLCPDVITRLHWDFTIEAIGSVEDEARRIIRTGLQNKSPIRTAVAISDAAAMLRSLFPSLTPRESEVLWAAVVGDDYHHVASSLGMQPATARNHLQRVLGKLGVHSQRQAVLKAALALVTPATGSCPEMRTLPGAEHATTRSTG